MFMLHVVQDPPVLTCRRLWLLLYCVVFSARFAVGCADPESDRIYRTTAAEVSLTFSVADESDHSIPTLQKRDFVVVDGDFIVRNFRSFRHNQVANLVVGVLIDASESITPRFQQEITSALQLVSQSDAVPDGNLFVASFRGLRPTLICRGNCRASDAVAQIRDMKVGGLTPLFDSIAFAADLLTQQGEASTQRVLILFSDGEDTISRSTAADAIKSTWAGDVKIYTIDLAEAHPPPGGDTLCRLADRTGGRCAAIQQGAGNLIDGILDDFRGTYTVTYQPPTQLAGFHRVRILPARDVTLRFRCRDGYYLQNTAP
jgi:VWFA-related protein